MIIITFVLLFQVFAISLTQEVENTMKNYIVACHSTDFTCFKRQYQLLRDNVLLGNKDMDIPANEPFTFRYSDSGTCVKITGVEESELVAIKALQKRKGEVLYFFVVPDTGIFVKVMEVEERELVAVNYDGSNKKISMSFAMPVRLHQVDFSNDTGKSGICDQPDKDFEPVGVHKGPLKKFSGNATVEVTYPFRLHKKKGKVHMLLEDEELDVVLDVPDLSQYDKDSELERKLFEWSEWAYAMVQHVNIAEHTIAPYTDQFKRLFGILSLDMFILLYPSETYPELQFSYADDDSVPLRKQEGNL